VTIAGRGCRAISADLSLASVLDQGCKPGTDQDGLCAVNHMPGTGGILMAHTALTAVRAELAAGRTRLPASEP
jgi:hypothetical protein